MAINLSEIRTAVRTYLNTKVNVTISAIIPDVPNALSPNEEGKFNIEIANALEIGGGINLTNVRYRLTTTTPALLKFKVPPAALAIARSGVSAASAVIAPGTFVSEMFLFPIDNTLSVGDIDSLVGLKIKATQLGNASISCRIHADADLNYLFPKDEDSAIVSKVVTIV